MLTKEGCRARQKRLVEHLDKNGLDGAVITHRSHVYYFTGYLSHWNHAPAAYIDRSGRTTVVGWKVDVAATATDDFIEYPAHKFATMPSDQARLAAVGLARAVPKGKKLGADLAGPGAHVRLAGEAVDLTTQILTQRQTKDADEIVCLRRAIALCEKMYAHAKASMRPGLDEMQLFTELRAVATSAAEKDLEVFGNDFRSGEGGGTPRHRPMKDGELYVLDLGPSLNGYHADNCRTFAVNRKPTDAQHKAHAAIVGCLAHVEPLVKPGAEAASIWRAADAYLKSQGYSQGLGHHLGHGIGLQPHEAPQFNPEYSATVKVGDVITLEPGLYGPDINGGIRLEHDYYVGERGVERITEFPLDL